MTPYALVVAVLCIFVLMKRGLSALAIALHSLVGDYWCFTHKKAGVLRGRLSEQFCDLAISTQTLVRINPFVGPRCFIDPGCGSE